MVPVWDIPCKCQRERARQDRDRDVVRAVPRLPAVPRDAQRGHVRPKAPRPHTMAVGLEVAGAACPGEPKPSRHRKRHHGGFEALSRAKHRAARTDGGAGILILFSHGSASPRGGGPGTNKRRWLCPSRRQPGASPVRRHSPRGLASITSSELLVAGRDRSSGCPVPCAAAAPWDAPGDRALASPAPVMPCGKIAERREWQCR